MERNSILTSWDRAQALYDKNVELENKRRKSTQARVPSDPNAWQQMRENYESIIFEDHGFSEQHNVETALWLLHYRRIEEMRSRFQSALSSTSSSTSEGSKVSGRSDVITKIRLQFKTFLSEATGFYHELILKIKAKYGLPLGYFSEGSEFRSGIENDGKKSIEIMKALVSCHRCLIYLGDLARYKGLYGEEDCKFREYAAASSYYLQASHLWPSIGNSHHQLAILASYTGDDLIAVYRYYRSLAVKNPFTTARDNLIVAFEKNRQSFAQLLGDSQTSVRERKPRVNGKGRGKTDMKNGYRSSTLEEKTSNVEVLKSFAIRFVRLNGILFTRISIETIEEVLTITRSSLSELLSFGSEDKFHFGSDATENSLFFVRLTSMLIFTVYNVKKESECQTYTEIVQRAVLLQNAFTTAFELMGCIVERVLLLSDPSSSYLMPGILVFLEWLAFSPDISTIEVDNTLSVAKVTFWNICVTFLNKILSVSPTLLDENDDKSCFNSMRSYEGETSSCYALAEDFELRGFVPISPAHTILDFSRKLSPGSDGFNEKTARIKRVLAAGKALANVFQIGKSSVWFDPRANMFMIGENSKESGLSGRNIEVDREEDLETFEMGSNALSVHDDSAHVLTELDEEDEVIVFKPLVSGKSYVARTSASAVSDYSNFNQNSSVRNLLATGTLGNGTANIQPSAAISIIGDKYKQHQPSYPRLPTPFLNEVADLSNSMNVVRFADSGDFLEFNGPREAVRFNENGNFIEPNLQREPVRFNESGNFMEHNAPKEAFLFNASGNFLEPNLPREAVRFSESGNFVEHNLPREAVRFSESGNFLEHKPKEAFRFNAGGNFVEPNLPMEAVRFSESGNFMEPNVVKESVRSSDKGKNYVEQYNKRKEAARFNASGNFMERNFVQPPSVNSPSLFYQKTKMAESGNILAVSDDFSLINDSKNKKTASNRPVRHIGPPPGFSHVPSKLANEQISDISPADDYTWLDDYETPVPANPSAVNYLENNLSFDGTRHSVGPMSFPFPGKQGSHSFLNGNQQTPAKPDQYNDQSFWSDRFIV